jgi:hypothetical protein
MLGTAIAGEATVSSMATMPMRPALNTQAPAPAARAEAANVAVPPAAAVPQPVAKPGHPALYVVIGGVLALAALIGGGYYFAALADPSPATETSSAPAPAAAPEAATDPAPAAEPATSDAPADAEAPATASGAEGTTPPATESGAEAAAAVTSNTPAASAAPSAPASAKMPMSAKMPVSAKAPGAAKPSALAAGSGTASDASAAVSKPAPPAQPAQPAVDFEELEGEIDQLVIRAAAVNRSLDSLAQAQARQGLGLRGETVVRQENMNLNLTRTREALDQRNNTRLQKFKALAENDIKELERFLGR